MNHNSKIGRWQGAGLMATTLLGTSVFLLPQLTIAIAGNGALIAWILLTLAIIPVTLVFARLSSHFPHAAGPAYFVQQAFGIVAGRTIGLIFLLVIPLGAPAAILMIFQFVDSLIHLSPASQLFAQLSMLLLLFIANYRGIHISAKVQFMLTLAIITVVVSLFGASASNGQLVSSVAREYSFNGELIIAATSIAFWSFLGVEAMTHLANDFKDPKQDLIPAMMMGTVLVGLIYVACTILLLLIPTDHDLAMVGVFDQLLGGFGAPIIGILGIAGGMATVNVYTASVARLAWSFSNDQVLPRYFSKLNRHQVPARALAATLILIAIVLIFTFVSGQHYENLIAWSNGVFVVIYLASMLSAAKLLDNSKLFIGFGVVFCLILGWGLGWNMLYAIALVAITAPTIRWQMLHHRKKAMS